MLMLQYLHEVSFQETFTRRNVMTAHKTKVAGLGPVQRWSLDPECIATLCKELPHCAENAAVARHVHHIDMDTMQNLEYQC